MIYRSRQCVARYAIVAKRMPDGGKKRTKLQRGGRGPAFMAPRPFTIPHLYLPYPLYSFIFVTWRITPAAVFNGAIGLITTGRFKKLIEEGGEPGRKGSE